MRPGRAAVHTALPLIALAALAVLAPSPRPAALVPEPASGTGWVTSAAGRVVTDGHPQIVTLPVRRVAPSPTPRPVARQPAPVHTGPLAVSAPQPLKATRTAVPVVRDEYPYGTDASNGHDPWGFTMRQCVSYAAWRLAELGRPLDNEREHWGSALDWDEAAARLGHGVTTQPTVGAVAHWDAGEHSDYWSGASATSDGTFVAGAAGHVAWVVSAYGDGSVLVAQYNGTGDRTYSTMRVRAPRYLTL